MPITHTFQSAKAQSTDPTIVSKNEHNAPHVVDLSDIYTSAVHVDLRNTCVGDGVTNDTTAFAAAVSALAALGGGNIYVPQNKVFLTDRITHSTAGVTIKIYGPGEIKLRTTSDSLLKVTNGTLVLDGGLKLNGNNIGLTNDASCLALVTTGNLYIKHVSIYNSGNCGAGSNTGGRLFMDSNYDIYSCSSYGVHVMGIGKFIIGKGTIHNLDDTAIFVGPVNNGNTPAVSEGGLIEGVVINDIAAVDGGTGAHGNGINIYRIDNVNIGPCQINNVAFSFVRINNAHHGTINGVTGQVAGETGIWMELGATRYDVTACNVTDCQGHGIAATNVNNGAYGLKVSACTVTNFGLGATISAGIIMEHGIVSNCYVDGSGNTNAVWGVRLGPGGGTTLSWQARAAVIDVAGCKYALGIGSSVSGAGTRRVIAATVNIVRQDANFSSPIGAVGGSNSDAGNGSILGSTMRGNILWDRNYFNVPTGEFPTSAEIGSTMKQNGVWVTYNGSAWV